MVVCDGHKPRVLEQLKNGGGRGISKLGREVPPR